MSRPAALWTAFLVLWGGSLLWNGGVTLWGLPLLALATSALYLVSVPLLKGEALRIGRAPWIWLQVGLGLLLVHWILPSIPFLFPETAAWRARHGVSSWPASADAFQGSRTIAMIQTYVLAALLALRLRKAGLSTGALMNGLLGILAVEAAYGILQQLGGFRNVPFYGPRASPDSASGTLVGRNNFGGLMAAGLVLAAARAWSRFSWPPRRESGRADRFEAGLGWALLAALLAAAVVASKSRGGALCAAGGLLLLPFLHRGRAAAAAAAGLLGLILLGFLVADPSGLSARFSTLDPFDLSADLRWRIAAETARAAMGQPLLGYGWGAHAQAFHPHQPVTIGGQIQFAHNEYANLLFETGLLGLLLLLAGMVLWTLRVWKAQQPLPGPDRMPVAACLAALGALALHAFVDFDFRIPSIGLLAAVLIGAGAAAVRGGEPRPAWPAGILGLLFALGALAAQRLPRDPATEAEALLVLRWEPYNHRAALGLAIAAGEPRRFETAADLFPAHPELQKRTGLLFWLGEDREVSARCFRRLFEQDPGRIAGVMADLMTPETRPEELEVLIPELPGPRALFAVELAKRGRWREARALFDRHVPAVPENARWYDAFAAGLQASGQWGQEAQIRERRLEAASDPQAHAASARAWLKLGVHERALDRAAMAARIDPSKADWAGLKGDILAAQGRPLEAMEAYTAARALAPDSLEWALRRGRLALQERAYDVAAGDLGEVLRSRPEDRGARLGLAQAEAGRGRTDTAIILLEEWLARNPGDAAARALRQSIRR
jgi:tetratricopeptide (TPR) repeat protein/O-antigen ligase